MSNAPGCTIIAVADPGLRSLLSAQLGMAGELPISASHLDLPISIRARAASLLIVEEKVIDAPPRRWAIKLREKGWMGQIIIIIADEEPEGWQADDCIALIGRHQPGPAILARQQLWGEASAAAMRPESDPPRRLSAVLLADCAR